MTDDELMADLRRIATEIDAPPELVTESARAAFTTRRLDDELADLLHDSELSTTSPVRGAARRLLSFETAAVSLELQLEQTAGRISVRGLAVGATGEAEVESATQTGRAAIDDQGWFRLDGLPLEPFRIRVQATDGSPVTTGWIRP